MVQCRMCSRILQVSSILSILVLLTLCVSQGATPREKQQRNEVQVVEYKPRLLNEGDVIDDYALSQRLDYLGMPKIYSRDSSSRSRELTSEHALPAGALLDIYDIETGLVLTESETFASALAQSQSKNSSCLHGYCLNEHIFRGGHGEIWRANRRTDPSTSYILKRMHVEGREDIERCAIREIYFGTLLREEIPQYIARFENYFVLDGDYWLVFADEGISLQQFLYAMTISQSSAILEPSVLWRKMRTTKGGQETMRGILQKVVRAVAELHDVGIMHRDLKPGNILININDRGGTKVVLSDFSSGVSQAAFEEGLYGLENIQVEFPKGVRDESTISESSPSESEETPEYSPPEVILCEKIRENSPCAYDEAYPFSYDSWSLGVLLLEMILGTANIFVSDQRTTAMIQHRMRKLNRKLNSFLRVPSDRGIHELSYRAALSEFCIVEANDLGGEKEVLSLISLCSLHDLQKAIQKRDPLGVGFHDIDGLDLISKLLKWDPKERISPKEALNHPYFTRKQRNTQEDVGVPVVHINIENKQLQPSHAITIESSMFQFIEGPLKELLVAKDESFASRYFRLGSSSWYSEDKIEIDTYQLVDRTPDGASLTVLSESSTIPTLSAGDTIDDITFWCPRCGQSFEGDWTSCMTHVNVRKHGTRCLYSALDESFPNISDKAMKKGITISLRSNEESLPRCISNHPYFPIVQDAHSGWCDLQGRRRYIEDSHAVLFSDAGTLSYDEQMSSKYSFRLFGVFDGHLGSRASLFATRFLPHTFERYLNHDPRLVNFDISTKIDMNLTHLSNKEFLRTFLPRNLNAVLENGSAENLTVEHSLRSLHDAFILTNIEFLARSNSAEASGTTATIAVLIGQKPIKDDESTSARSFTHLLLGHVGDSRAVYCCSPNFDALALTLDHTPAVKAEAARVIQKGGFIDNIKDILRVNGKLAVTRSIGDRPLRKVLSAVPDMLLIELPEDTGVSNQNSSPCSKYFYLRARSKVTHMHYPFLVLASDGLWDVFTNQEAADFVCDLLVASELRGHEDRQLSDDAFQIAARALALEAFVRGSSDNIGVCVVDIV